MTKKQYFETCPICGANLYPGELCSCTVDVAGNAYHVIGSVEDKAGNIIPLIDMPLIDDESFMKKIPR